MEKHKDLEIVKLLDSLVILIDREDVRLIRKLRNKYNNKIEAFSLANMQPINATNSELGFVKTALKKMVYAIYKNNNDELSNMCDKTVLDDYIIFSKVQCNRKIKALKEKHWYYNENITGDMKTLTAIDKLIKIDMVTSFYNQHKTKLILSE